MRQCDIDRVNSVIRKARRWGLTNLSVDFDSLASRADNVLFGAVLKPGHCIHHLLPETKTNNKYNLRTTTVSKYIIPKINYDKLHDSYIYRCC